MILKLISQNKIKFIDVKNDISINEDKLFIDDEVFVILSNYKEIYLLNDSGDTIEVIKRSSK